ncbi:MAG: beta-lactamase family protein [Bacteroidales bacterium]|nr:beta-lactamase family protein [Bacteroidales bacterium]
MRRLVSWLFLAVLVSLMGLMAMGCTKANAVRDKQCRRDNPIVRADSTSPFVRELAHYIDSTCNRLNGTLIIARHDTILLERACGYLQLFREATGYDTLTYNDLARLRKREDNRMTMNTLFDLASVSKQFTAAAILKLCYEGKIKLTDSLCRFFPSIPYKNVTIKQLLTHTSGIPEYFTFDFNIYDTTFFIDNDQLVQVLGQQRFPRMFVRGAGFKYVNTNYALLAAIVSDVTGDSFEHYVRTNLWEPAGMENTRFFTEIVGISPVDLLQHDPAEKGQEYVIAYPMACMSKVPVTRGHWRSGALAQYDRLNGILGDKGVYASAEDLIKWTNAYYIQHKILPKEWVDEATRAQNKLNNGIYPKESYGYGVRMEEKEKSGFVIYHGGLWDGYHNVWMYRPSDGLQIVFLSNFYNRAHTGKCDQILQFVDSLYHR